MDTYDGKGVAGRDSNVVAMRTGSGALQERPRQRRPFASAIPIAASDGTSSVVSAPALMAAPAKCAYLAVLTWAFTFFNSVRILSYLPTLWAINAAADSSQYSLWTWGTWLGANATMAAWLYESNGHRLDRAVALNIGNAVMCVASFVLIAWYRS